MHDGPRGQLMPRPAQCNSSAHSQRQTMMLRMHPPPPSLCGLQLASAHLSSCLPPSLLLCCSVAGSASPRAAAPRKCCCILRLLHRRTQRHTADGGWVVGGWIQYLPACLPACLACLPACLPACLLACLPACLLGGAFQHADTQARMHTSLRSHPKSIFISFQFLYFNPSHALCLPSSPYNRSSARAGTCTQSCSCLLPGRSSACLGGAGAGGGWRWRWLELSTTFTPRLVGCQAVGGLCWWAEKLLDWCWVAGQPPALQGGLAGAFKGVGGSECERLGLWFEGWGWRAGDLAGCGAGGAPACFLSTCAAASAVPAPCSVTTPLHMLPA
jgi:hypothetical protein